jgi:hypothetical protein
MRSRSRRLIVPAVLSVIVIGGAIDGCDGGCNAAVVPDAMPTDTAVSDARDATVADTADRLDAPDTRDARDAGEVADAQVDAAPPDTPT